MKPHAYLGLRSDNVLQICEVCADKNAAIFLSENSGVEYVLVIGDHSHNGSTPLRPEKSEPKNSDNHTGNKKSNDSLHIEVNLIEDWLRRNP